MSKKKILFGCGHYGKLALEEYGDEVTCFIDNQNGGSEIFGVPVLGWETFLSQRPEGDVIVCIVYHEEVAEQLWKAGVDYEIYYKLNPLSSKISHTNWADTLAELCDKPGKRVLEIGSRVVTGGCFRDKFQQADYLGFDYYAGENVDVVGDAHELSKYFSKDEKFDLIFSSAVFEHFAMPWKVAEEINKLLAVGGYVFVETHCSFSVHERPWHFFQFSDKALEVLFSPAMGIEKIESGVSNPIVGSYTDRAAPYLRGRLVTDLFCHSEFLGKKICHIENFEWNRVRLDDVTNGTCYPKPR